MNSKRVLIPSIAVLLVVMTPRASKTDVPLTTAVLRDDTPVQEVCRRRDRLTLRMRTQQGGLVQMADSFNRARFAQFGGGYDLGAYSAGGYSVGGYSAGSRSICGVDAYGASVCPPTSYSYELPTRSYDLGVRSSYSFSPPVSYSFAQPAVSYSAPSISSCEQVITEILKTLLQELVAVQARQNELLMTLLRERSGGAGTYEQSPRDLPSPRPSSPLNRS